MIPNCLRTFTTQKSFRHYGSWFQVSKDIASRMVPDFVDMTTKSLLSFFASSKSNYATEATLETKNYKLHKLESGPMTSVKLTSDQALKLYKDMFVIRRLETSAGNLYKEKIIRGFCHLYSGQEAVATGIRSSMRDHDAVITAYRAHGWSYLMGVPLIGVLSELTGRNTGCARGKGGSMHMYAKNFYGGNGIVGAQVPLGVGIALAAKYKDTDGVCFACYGDGAANQGQLFEVFNIAKLLNLPCIFVCENNGYGMGTSSERSSASTAYYTRGDYIPGIWVDGMDVLAVQEASRFAIEHCKQGKGPIILETATYRYSGHSMSDPGTSYRTRDEVQDVRQKRDPITSFREKITTTGLTSNDDLKKLESEIRASVDEATKKSKTEKEIGLDELSADIYCNYDQSTPIRSILPWFPLQHKRLGEAQNI